MECDEGERRRSHGLFFVTLMCAMFHTFIDVLGLRTPSYVILYL